MTPPGPVTFDVRPIADADLPGITDLYGQHVEEGTASWELEAPDLAEMTARRDAVLARGMPYLVAARGDEVLGYAHAGPFRPRPAYRYTVENTVYVRRDMMGRGVAGPLMERLIEACTAAGFRQMVAVIGDSRSNPSIRFHEKLGFRRAGFYRDIGWKHGRWLDGVVMQLALGLGGESPPE